MNYLVFIYDPKRHIIQHEEFFISKELSECIEGLGKNISLKWDLILNTNSIGNAIDQYIERKRFYDQVIFFYDGNLWMDSLANHSFLTMVSRSVNSQINHHTHKLIDIYLKTSYEEINHEKIYAEILYNMYKRLHYDVVYDKDNIKDLKEKQVRIDELKKYF